MKTLLVHVVSTLLFSAVLVLNHRLKLNLTTAELALLATALGVHQVTTLVRALTGKPNVS